MSDNNPSILLHGPESSSISTTFLPVPSLSAYPADNVLLRVSHVGVCGSDVHFYLHGGVGADPRKYAQHFCSQGGADKYAGLVMGHEATATVLEVGSNVDAEKLKPGDHVVVEPGVPCRTCKRCAEGMYNLCPSMRFAASFFEEESLPKPIEDGESNVIESKPRMRATHGLLCKYYVLPASLCYKLPNSISLQEGILVEPLAVAVHAARLAELNPLDEAVLITGAGTVGVLLAAVCCAYGVSKITLVDVDALKLEFAKSWLYGSEGAATKAGVEILLFDSSTVPATPDGVARKLKNECIPEIGVDVALEASGHPSATALAIHALRPGGKMVQTGLSKTPTMDSFPIVDLSEKEIHLHGAFRYKDGDFAVATQLLARGVVGPVGQLISRIWPFKDYELAWKATMKGGGQGTKNIIQVESQ